MPCKIWLCKVVLKSTILIMILILNGFNTS